MEIGHGQRCIRRSLFQSSRSSLEDMLMNVPSVCSSWRKASLDPSLWERVDLRDWGEDFADADRMVRLVVDRSCGRLQEFSLAGYGTDDMLAYIAERCASLKGLCFSSSDITDSGVCQIAHKLPELEKLIVSGCDGLSKLALEELGQSCKGLGWLERSGTADSCFTLVGSPGDDEAMAIAENMPHLKHLEMAGTEISDEGLQAVLDGCCDLEYLDVCRCSNLVLETPTWQKCCRLKEFYYEEEDSDLEFDDPRNWELEFDDPRNWEIDDPRNWEFGEREFFFG